MTLNDRPYLHNSSNRLLHKSVHTMFLITSYSAFVAIRLQILKSHFEQKQSKRDYQKKLKGRKMHPRFFLVLGYMHFSEKRL